MPTGTSPKRRRSRIANRRSKMLPTKVKPGLAVDTSVSQHRAPAPKQVFPQEPKTQELSFVSLADIKALRKQRSINKARQRQLRNAPPVPAQRSYSEEAVAQAGTEAPPPYARSTTTDAVQPSALHKRLKGLRPSPLDLSADISPSDRAITIGISLDPNTVPRHSRTPSSPVAAQLYRDTGAQRRPSEKGSIQEAVTPTIVITPAQADFDFELDEDVSPTNTSHTQRQRPASSVYSRHTNCMPPNGYTPPVPPLPLFAVEKSGKTRESNGTVFEEEACSLAIPKRERKNNLSVCTVFEEDNQSGRSKRRSTSQSMLPTPRRSRGWWNLVTSPFSAGSVSSAFFWRSPPPLDDGDNRSRMLDDASDVATNSHEGIIFANRAAEDLDLRSAPPATSRHDVFGTSRLRQPKRSDTAPGALDPNEADGVNIYAIPWVGAAADYFNPHKNFPSMVIEPEALEGDRGLQGWSPSQSVYRQSRGAKHGALVDINEVDDDSDSTFIDDADPFDDETGVSRGLDDSKSPFGDHHASNTFEGFSGTQPAAGAGKGFFSTPSTDELRGASPQETVRPEPTRNGTHATIESHFSPLSATPVIEDAKMGTLMGPSMVDVRATPGRAVSPYASGLGAATMASRSLDSETVVSEKPSFRPQHQRNDSYGLGIDTDDQSMSEKSLFPPPKPLRQQPRLGTDRFGQLRIEHDGDVDINRTPWYRRFLWPLIGLAMALLILFVVLLAVFLSQAHDDMPVQAEWLNLTGYPAMPTGVATIVQPKQDVSVGGCVKPENVWNCAVPAGSDQGGGMPNFRFEIRLRNSTRSGINSTELTPSSTGVYRRSVTGASLASNLLKRSTWSKSLYASEPAPPSEDDMIFLGNTTDGIEEPFEGEATPFYISLLNSIALDEPRAEQHKLGKRERGDGVYPYPTSDSDSPSNATSSSSSGDSSGDSESSDDEELKDAPSDIPRLRLQPNGHPAPAQLYPLAYAQPLRLFNRGQGEEHYGFYTYYDRSVYLSTADVNATSTSAGNSTLGGNVTANGQLEDSNAVCVFSQTRLHVQIWTRKATVSGLNRTSDGVSAVDSSANDMTFPGSFPYPVTVTLDRHGGDAGKKAVYCYGLDADGHVLSEAKTWVAEDRGFGGTIIDAAVVPGSQKDGLVTRDDSDGGAGKGIDGGDGGCRCSWKNWEGK